VSFGTDVLFTMFLTPLLRKISLEHDSVLPMTQANDQLHPSTAGPWIPESQSPLVLQNRQIQGLESLANHPSGSLSHFESFNSAAGTEVQNDSEFRMSRPVSAAEIEDDSGYGTRRSSTQPAITEAERFEWAAVSNVSNLNEDWTKMYEELNPKQMPYVIAKRSELFPNFQTQKLGLIFNAGRSKIRGPTPPETLESQSSSPKRPRIGLSQVSNELHTTPGRTNS
jgi:hypothetical protein